MKRQLLLLKFKEKNSKLIVAAVCGVEKRAQARCPARFVR
jgi:hypothetical protein